MSKVNASIQIDAPPEEVWAVVMDPERLGDWVTIHRKVGKISDRPLRDGSTLEQTLCLRGANFKVKWKVDEAREGECAVWEGKGPARSKAHTTYRLSANGNGGTRFDYENEFKAPLGPLGAAASRALIGGVPQREANRTLQQLKRVVEGGG
jgi:carbon monoxide dehydrogenase subunit G